MPLTYDQRSELRLAFEEANVEADRRRACRVKVKVPAKLAPWNGKKPDAEPPLDVMIEDFSTTGVGVIYGAPLEENDRYLMEVPRHNAKPAWVVLRVARCMPMDDGTFGVGLEMCELLEAGDFAFNPFTGQTSQPARGRTMGKRTKLWFLVFAIIGVAISAFI